MTTAPVRVAFVLPNLMLGGAEHQAIKLLTALPPGAVTVTLIVLQGWYPQPLRDAVPAGVDVQCAPYGRHDPRVVLWLARHIRGRRVQVVQAFLWYAELIAALACRLAGTATLIGSERGDRADTFYGRIRRALDRLIIIPGVECFVSNSSASTAALLRAGVPANRIELIPNGVPVDADNSDAGPVVRRGGEGGLIACSVGSLQPYKDVETLVRAVAASNPTSEVRAVIVGEGPEQTRLEQLASELGVGGQVEFVGRQYPPQPWMRAADVGVQSSRRDEACSNSVLEFMACARPVMATRTGGNPELVTDKVTGWLFPPGDWRALASLLDSAAQDRRALEAMGTQAAAHVRERFSIDSAAMAFARLWSRMVSANRHRKGVL